MICTPSTWLCTRCAFACLCSTNSKTLFLFYLFPLVFKFFTMFIFIYLCHLITTVFYIVITSFFFLIVYHTLDVYTVLFLQLHLLSEFAYFQVILIHHHSLPIYSPMYFVNHLFLLPFYQSCLYPCNQLIILYLFHL